MHQPLRFLPAGLALLLVGCACDPKKGPGKAADDPVDTAEEAPSSDAYLREEVLSPGSVRFNELLYHSAAESELEWIELHNPMAVDVDLSDWKLSGGVDYRFPTGTVIAAGGFVVVASDPSRVDGALGPFEGTLHDDGERVDLKSNGDRRIDSIGYGDDDPWPVGADGTGASLSKLVAASASDRAENWAASLAPGGTPGADNGPTADAPPKRTGLVALDAHWTYDVPAGELAEDWAEPGFDDDAWAEDQAPFVVRPQAESTPGVLRITADNYYAAYLGEADGSALRLVASDADGDWTTVDSFAVALSPRDHLYVAAWEATGDNVSPQMVIAELETDEGLLGTAAADFDWVLGPVDGCPGVTPPGPAPAETEIEGLVLDADADGGWSTPAAEAGPDSSPWGWATSSAVDPSTQFIWPDTFANESVTNVDNTWVLFRSVDPVVGAGQTSGLRPVPTTAAFRTRFSFDGDPAATSLRLDCTLDDGVVVYLNGVEVLRENLPAGALSIDTLATAETLEALSASVELSGAGLRVGQNVLAAELHQADDADEDLHFACALTAWEDVRAPEPEVRFSELPAASESPFWVELVGADDTAATLDGLLLRSTAGSEQVLDGGTLAPEALALISPLDFAVAEGDVLSLWTADGSRLLDAARVGAALRGRAGPAALWRFPDDPTPGKENVVTVEENVVLNELMIHHPDAEEEWIELYNRGDGTVDLSGWRLADAVAFPFPTGTTLKPGEFLVVAGDAAAFQQAHPGVAVVGNVSGRLANGSERVLLLDARGNPADEVRFHVGGRWPQAVDGGGSSLELRDPRADNASAEAWAPSDSAPQAEWVDFAWEGTADASVVGPDGAWNELVMGLLGAGELLIDDVSVIEDPSGAAREVVQNGSFDAGSADWRLLGNHRHAEVVPDPDDPQNPVLRLVATGPTGHMHNHAETTLSRPLATREYAVSFRARWVSGSNQLNTRLYFNRLAKTVRVTRPERFGTPGAHNSVAVDNLGPTFADLRPDQAVPSAGQDLGVAVTVDDPDGVARVALYTSIDGAAFASTPMTEAADGRWQASVERQPAGTLIQLYVEATDGLGATTWFPAAGPDSRALLRVDDGRAVDSGLHNLRLLLTDADAAWLHEDVNLMSDDLVGATVIVNEEEVYWNVGLRLKGSQRGRPETPRLGYALRFNDDQPFRGTHTSVHIDRSEGVGYGQREMLVNVVMTGAGALSGEYNDLIHAITPFDVHTGPAELQLDRAGSLMLDAQLGDDGDGALFEYELVYYPLTTDDGSPEGLKLPQPDAVTGNAVTDLGDDPEAWRWTFMLQTQKEGDDFAPIMGLGELFALPTADFLAAVEEVIDVEQWLRAFAFATLSGAGDNYGADGSWHNARFYQRPRDGRFLFFPHDMDFVWSATLPVVGNGDLARLLTHPGYQRSYYGHLDDILGHTYNAAYLQPWCDQFQALTGQDFAAHCDFVTARAQWVRSDASDSIHRVFPAQEFEISTDDGLAVDGLVATLEGVAWVDVRGIVHAESGQALTVTWLDSTHWQVEVELEAGTQTVSLQGTDLRGEVVATDSVEITATP